jgi:hypothetical protein
MIAQDLVDKRNSVHPETRIPLLGPGPLAKFLPSKSHESVKEASGKDTHDHDGHAFFCSAAGDSVVDSSIVVKDAL